MNRPIPRARPCRAPRASGFTLIELMITVAIVALLGAIALPAYTNSVWKGKRGEAKSAMMKALQAEERYYTQNNTYVAYTTTPPSGAFPVFSADNAGNSRYTITALTGPLSVPGPGPGPTPANVTLCPSPNNAISQCVIIKATVVGTADPDCGTALYMDSTSNKGEATSSTKALCWK